MDFAIKGATFGKVSVGLSTIAGFLLAAVAALTPALSQWADVSEPLGVQDSTWFKASAALAVVTVVGRGLQAAATAFGGVAGNVSIGPGTIAGFVGVLATALTPIVGELADTSQPLGMDPAFWLTTSAVLSGVTIGSRQLQAFFDAIGNRSTPLPDPVLVDGEEIEELPTEPTDVPG